MAFSIEAFIANVRAEAANVAAKWEAFNVAHPGIASDEADALDMGVAGVAAAATAEVETAAPKSADELLDAAIAAAQAEGDKQIAVVTATTASKVAALQSAKSTAPAIQDQPQ